MPIYFILATFAFTAFPSFADNDAQKHCFDFNTPNFATLRTLPEKFKEDEKDISEQGTNAQDTAWAYVSGTVNKPIADLYQKLLDPKTIRNGDNVKVKTKDLEPKNFLNWIEESIDLRPTFFLSLTWKEHWVYALKDGTKEAPKRILISHQKIEGTSHIQRICGNILLQSVTPTKTGVAIYMEMKAARRNSQNVLDDISGTLRTLRP